jgi:hypothetical protein
VAAATVEENVTTIESQDTSHEQVLWQLKLYNDVLW